MTHSSSSASRTKGVWSDRAYTCTAPHRSLQRYDNTWGCACNTGAAFGSADLADFFFGAMSVDARSTNGRGTGHSFHRGTHRSKRGARQWLSQCGKPRNYSVRVFKRSVECLEEQG